MSSVILFERRRKLGLGRYSCTRLEWDLAWRQARHNKALGLPPDPKKESIEWRAMLIAESDRSPLCDPLAIPVENRLAAMRMIREITLG